MCSPFSERIFSIQISVDVYALCVDMHMHSHDSDDTMMCLRSAYAGVNRAHTDN